MSDSIGKLQATLDYLNEQRKQDAERIETKLDEIYAQTKTTNGRVNAHDIALALLVRIPERVESLERQADRMRGFLAAVAMAAAGIGAIAGWAVQLIIKQ